MRKTIFLAGLLALVASCARGANQAPLPPAKSISAKKKTDVKASEEPLLGPARYALTESLGISYDEGVRASPVPRREPAISSGNRVMLDGGVIIASAPSPEPLIGFRSLPAHLGGGFVVWSDSRTYRAETFLGDLRPIVDIGAEGGVRPWFHTFVLRTSLGLFEVDPSSLALRRTDLARFSEVLSLDGKNGVRLDALGRAEISTDGGQTFREPPTERPTRFTGLELGPPGTIFFLRDGGLHNKLDKNGVFGPLDASTEVDVSTWETPVLSPEDTTAPSQRLAPTDFDGAVMAGIRLPGGRALVVREQMLRVFSLQTGQVIDEASLSSFTEPYTHCQPASLGPDVFLACTHPHGSHFLALRGDPSSPRVEATFPDPTSTFVAGLGKRFLFNGRCGGRPAGTSDFQNPPAAPTSEAMGPFGPGGLFRPPGMPGVDPEPEADPPEPPDPPEPDDARACIREADGNWQERRLSGDLATHLYKWIPGDAGEAIALVFESKTKPQGKKKKKAKKADAGAAEKEKPEAPPEGVRVIRIDPEDPALEGARFPALMTPMEEPPYRSIDPDFWLDERDGSIHGWVLLPGEGEEPAEGEEPSEIELVPQGRANRLLPVSQRIGGPTAGVRIDANGSIEVYPLPKGVNEVIRGGRFALARAESESGVLFYETTDGGKTFSPAALSPLGDMLMSVGENRNGCTALGCSLGDGIVRLGWGGSAPAPPNPEKDLGQPPNPAPPRLLSFKLACRNESTRSGASPLTATVSLRSLPGKAIGSIEGGSLVADVFWPFDLGPAHHVKVEAPTLERAEGDLVPVLLADEKSPIGFFFRNDKLRIDLAPKPSPAAFTLSQNRRYAAAADLGGGELLFLDAESSELFLAREDAVRSFFKIARVPDVTRSHMTLARRVGKGPAELAIALVSGASGDILLSELDLARGGFKGPPKRAGSLSEMRSSCSADPSAYRLLADVLVDVEFDAETEHDAPDASALALVTVGGGRVCLEGLEVRLPRREQTLVWRAARGDASIREGGRIEKATCKAP